MNYHYRSREEHGVYVTGDYPDFPMPLKDKYFLLSVRERVAANLEREALLGESKKGKRLPDVQKAAVLHDQQQQELTEFIQDHPPTPKTERHILHILDHYLPQIIDK